MKLITRDTDYAVRALCFIAHQKERVVSVNELVKELAIPKPFLRKILQILNKKGILYSHKGAGGGFSLARPADKIFIVELMEVFQGEFSLNECLFKKKACPQRPGCSLRKRIAAIEDKVRHDLNGLTVQSLLKEARA